MRTGGFGVVLVAIFAACSGSKSGSAVPASCTAFSACGGNVVGTWQITSLCGPGATQTAPVMGCPGGMAVGTFTATGTIVFNSDSTYTITSTTTGSGTAVFPNSCLNGTTCAEVQNNVVGGTIMSATCTSDNTNCNCTLVFAPDQTMSSGTYAVSGTTLTTTPNGAAASQSTPFCVSANQLSIQSSDANAMNVIIVASK